jgi:ABC-type multidrug transport system fused ATPase/permease subunit
MSGPLIEVREPEATPRQVEIEDSVEVGRECDGIVVADEKVSRRHLNLAFDGDVLVVTDLDSTNGTTVNGNLISAPTPLHAGDIVRAGSTEFEVLGGPPSVSVAPVPGTDEVAAPPPGRPALEEFASISSDGAVVRYRAGSIGERFAEATADAARRARRKLAGLGSEPWGTRPTICLSDPFADPARTSEVIADGTIVDPAHGEIWMVVTSEAPPEPLERPLALFYGAALPAAADLQILLEGYGLNVSDSAATDAELAGLELPALEAAEGELRSAMAESFVRYVLDRFGKDDFLRLLADSQPGKVDATAQQIYGKSTAALEEAWRNKLAEGTPDVRMGQFFRLITRYLRPHIRREIEMFVYMLLGLAFTVVFPFAFRRLLDDAIPSGEFSEVVSILAVLGVAFGVSLLAGLRRAYLAAVVSSAVVRQVRTDMFGRLQDLSSRWFSRRQQGDVLSRLFSDVQLLEMGLSETLREGSFQVLSLVVSAVVLVLLDPFLALIVLLGAPLVALVYRAMAKGAQRRSIAVQEQTGTVLTVATENYAAQPVVKAFGVEDRERARFGQASDRLFDNEVRLQLFGGLFTLSVNMIVSALRLIVLGVGAWLILNGNLTIGGLVAFVSLMGEVISPVTVLTGLGQQVQASTGALVRINEILNAVPDIADDPEDQPLPPLEDSIALSDVSFSYTPERRTLEHVEVRIAAGSRVAFVGPTGAGKSSVLQLLMRFYDPDEGAVLFDGKDVRGGTLASLRDQLGVVFQETFLFDATIAENIALGRPRATDAEIEAAARAAELDEFVESLPRSYDTLVGERGGRLSGGQRQRLAIARALLRDPRVLLLDEATSALDPRTERMIADTLEKAAHGRTTIAVTHRLTSVTSYDQVFVMDGGRLVEHGTHDELLARDGLYARLWAEQVGGRVATEAPFEAATALGRIVLFEGLSTGDLEEVASRLRHVELAPGETLAEGGGRLVIVRRGRGKTLVPGLTGKLAPVADLGAGDAFGLAALLGQPSGAVLQAVDSLSLLVLDDEAISALAVTFPAVASALEGERLAARPAGGTRLPRMTIAPRAAASTAPRGVVPVPVEEIRRASGAFLAVRP